MVSRFLLRKGHPEARRTKDGGLLVDRLKVVIESVLLYRKIVSRRLEKSAFIRYASRCLEITASHGCSWDLRIGPEEASAPRSRYDSPCRDQVDLPSSSV